MFTDHRIVGSLGRHGRKLQARCQLAGHVVCVCVLFLNRVLLFVTMDVAHQAPLSMGFPRQEHWSG